MSPSRRRSLADVVGPAALDTPAIPAHPLTAQTAPEASGRGRHPAVGPPPAGNPPRPTARDLAAPPRGPVAREALKADVPADLGLLQRLRRYRLDNGMDIRDQVAIAVDEWLTSQGY